ncbi:hypothetical protein EDC01DRAFT_664447 [Geopyxis carbonaria]|nr:hypothetical protein EDC01DRAFT_664447 [Geopyxis carbonaria]
MSAETLTIPLASLASGTQLDLTSLPANHFRFLSIPHYLSASPSLHLTSHATLESAAPYAALSYPWRDLAPPASSTAPMFGVAGVTADAGRVSLAVLRTACLRARHHGAQRLWLDRVCINQTEAALGDRDWHMARMGTVYAGCAVCLVFAGGIQRLGGVQEATAWIGRVWTLLEAVLPPKVECVFRWEETREVVELVNLVAPEVVEPGVSAVMELGWMLSGVLAGGQYRYAGEDEMTDVQFALFGHPEAYVLQRLLEEEEPEKKEAGLWRSAWMRTASWPRDMALCMMGLFGVELNPGDYVPDEQQKPMMDLARAVLARGGSAGWMGLSLRMAPADFMSTMCLLPIPRDRGGVRVVMPGVGPVATNTLIDPYWLLVGAPKGSLDAAGYMTTTVQARELSVASEGDEDGTLSMSSGEKWSIPETAGSGKYFALVVGKMIPSVGGALGMIQIEADTVVMVVQREGESGDTYNVKGYVQATPQVVEDWQEREFRVGGPRAV